MPRQRVFDSGIDLLIVSDLFNAKRRRCDPASGAMVIADSPEPASASVGEERSVSARNDDSDTSAPRSARSFNSPGRSG